MVDDGLLDFVLIRKPAYSRIPGLVPKYKRGEHLSNPAFSDLLVYRRGVKIEIQSENEVVSNMDGLCIKVKSEEYNILPHALNFILPHGAALPKEPKMRGDTLGKAEILTPRRALDAFPCRT